MRKSISHDRNDESMEAKTRWFQSLSLEERMEMLCDFTEMALTVNPSIQDERYAQPIEGRIRVVEKA